MTFREIQLLHFADNAEICFVLVEVLFNLTKQAKHLEGHAKEIGQFVTLEIILITWVSLIFFFGI